MSKNNRKGRNAPVAAMNEIDTLLASVEPTVTAAPAPTGLLAFEGLEEADAELVTAGDHPNDDEVLLDLGEVLETLPEAEVELVDDGIPALDKTEFYENQGNTVTVANDGAAAPVVSNRSRKKAGNIVVSAGAVPKVPRINTTGMSRADTLSAKVNLADLEKIGVDADDIPKIVDRINELPVKVQDKAYNMIRFFTGRDTLSNYTMFVVQLLANGEALTVPQIVAAMEKRGWSAGTSRSQSQQVSRLFRAYDMTLDGAKGILQLDTSKPFVTNLIDRLPAMPAAA